MACFLSSESDGEFLSGHVVEPVDPPEGDEIPFEAPAKVSISLPETKKIDVFLFHVHEEGSSLYLFCKHPIGDRYYSVCVQVSSPCYYVQFLPIKGHELAIGEEVRDIAHACGGSLISGEMKTMRYCFGNAIIPETAQYFCAVLSSKCVLAKIKQKGRHYSHVFGLTASLTEHFVLRRKITGPCWVTVENAEKRQKVTTISMFSVPNIECVSPLENNRPAPMNIATMAIRAMFRSHEIFMISLRIFREWDVERFTGTGMKHITFMCSTSGAEVTPAAVAEKDAHWRIYGTEKEMLKAFVKTVDHYDIDILASYGLVSVDLPLLFDRIRENEVENWWRIGRLKRNGLPKQMRLNGPSCLSGRVPCDLRTSCMDYMRAKSNDLSAAVQNQFGFVRQQIDHFEVVECLKNLKELRNLVNYNTRDTLFVAQLLNAMEILPLSLQISQFSGCLWARVVLGQASPRCESLLLRYFFEKDFVLPEKVVTNQRKEPAFPGGLVLQPKRGFYETVIVAMDYFSLYPSIIIEYNLCFTTVDPKDPDPEKSRKNTVRGILPTIMEDLLNERQKVKTEIEHINASLATIEEQFREVRQQMEAIQSQMSIEHRGDGNEIGYLFNHHLFVEKSSQFGRDPTEMYSQIGDRKRHLKRKRNEMELELQRLNRKQAAVKVLANAIYGYLGYRHSRFQNNTIAALIAQQGRRILQRTVEIVEMTGRNTVVYGDTDSVMIDSGTADVSEALSIADDICKRVSSEFSNLKLGVEGVFLKMLLVQKKRYVVLVYDGPGKSHQETKGIELIRRDWCGLTKYISAFILDQFLHSESRDTAIENIITELGRLSRMLRNNGTLGGDVQIDSTANQPSEAGNTASEQSILPVVGFPQMYGNAALKPKAEGQQPMDVPLKQPCVFQNKTENNAFSILRAYGIVSRFSADPNKSQPDERIRPIEKIGLEQLVIHMTLSKPLDKYQDRMTPHVAVARRMQERGENVGPNMTIGFIIANAGSKDVGENARIPDELKAVSDADVEWYLSNQILAPIWRLCEPFGGMDVRMISKALGLVVPESVVPAQRDECVALIIPHISELQYQCPHCTKLITLSFNLCEHFKCPTCGTTHPWRVVANQLTTFIRSFLRTRRFVCCQDLCGFQTHQLPVTASPHKCSHRLLKLDASAVSIFNTLRYFASFFDKSNNREDAPYEPYRHYMHRVTHSFLNLHGFMKIQLRCVFSEVSSVSQATFSGSGGLE